MLVGANEVETDSRLSCDLCILGGGAAGITIARELSRTGLDVCVVESGDFHYSDRNQDLYQVSEYNPVFPDPQWSRLRYWGGSTNHWEGNCTPLSEIDFEKRSFVPHSGWPLKRKDLDTFYRRASVYCELGEYNHDSDYWTSRSEMKSPDLTSARIHTGVARSSPPTRFGEVWGRQIIDASNVRVFMGANVVDLEFDEKLGKVGAIKVKNLDGNQFSIAARSFVVCFGGIENARMLLFWNSKFENRLGNQGDSVGRYFMDHPVIEGAFFLPTVPRSFFDFYHHHSIDGQGLTGFWELSDETLRERELTNIRMPFVAVSKLFASDGVSSFHMLKNSDAGGELWHHLRNVLRDIDMVLEASVRRKTGRKMFDSADDFAGFLFDTMIEQRPKRENRIRLSADMDALGVPRAKVEWRISDADIDNTWKAYKVVAEEVGRLGLGRMRLLRDRGPRIWGGQMSFGNHHMGSTRMWNNPEHGVVDANSKVHGTRNLFVAGSSVFPTGGHVPPTLTIVALAIRLSDHLKELMKVEP